jgi:hypothetical protein
MQIDGDWRQIPAKRTSTKPAAWLQTPAKQILPDLTIGATCTLFTTDSSTWRKYAQVCRFYLAIIGDFNVTVVVFAMSGYLRDLCCDDVVAPAVLNGSSYDGIYLKVAIKGSISGRHE